MQIFYAQCKKSVYKRLHCMFSDCVASETNLTGLIPPVRVRQEVQGNFLRLWKASGKKQSDFLRSVIEKGLSAHAYAQSRKQKKDKR